MAKDKNQFVEHIEKGMTRFGMSLESSDVIGDDLNQLVLRDNTYKTGYIALARRKDTKNPSEFWGKVIDKQLKNALQESAYKGDPLPAALIVPSGEADAVIAKSTERGIKPSVYQLFDGYVVIGYSRKDSGKLLNKAENKPPEPAERAPATAEPAQTEVTAETPNMQELKKRAGALPGINPKKLAAAALLGVTIASIPFAINKLKDGQQTENYVENPIMTTILTDAREGGNGLSDIQSALAANAPLPDYSIEKLISEGYLRDVAQNPNINDSMLRRFASDPDPLVRAAAARNSSTTGDILRKLADDKSSAVRASAAINPNLPQEILAKLSLDNENAVRSAVLESPNLTPPLLDRLEPNISHASCANKEKIFASPCVSSATLAYNANNPDVCVRRGVAKNPLAEKEILSGLRNDPDQQARGKALSNPSIDKDELMGVFPKSWGGGGAEEENDPERVRDIQAALGNGNAPPSIIQNALNANPNRYGAAVAGSPALSRRNAAFLYDYSAPKGGMNGFFTAVSALPQDKTLLDQINNNGSDGAPLKNSFPALRKKINRLFADNLYNPITAAQMIGSEDNKSANSDGGAQSKINGDWYNPIVMPETEDGGAFFDDNQALSLDGKEFDRFTEFFDDDEQPLSDKAVALLETADSIVDGIMEELLPAIERSAAGDDNGAKSNNETAFEQQTNERETTLSGAQIAGKTADASSAANSADVGVQLKSPIGSVLSEALYNKSCRQIDSMLNLF